MFAEALMHTRRIGDPQYGDGGEWEIVIRIVLGLLVIALAARTIRHRAPALATALPLAGLGSRVS